NISHCFSVLPSGRFAAGDDVAIRSVLAMTRVNFASVMMGYSLSFAALLPVAWGDGPTKKESGRMRVELDAFSGKQNPAWDLSDAQVKGFGRAFESLVPVDPDKRDEGKLGYRGFKVTGFRD